MAQQISFDPFDYLTLAEQAIRDKDGIAVGSPVDRNLVREIAKGFAKAERDLRYRELKKFHNVTRFVLRNQLEPYQALGVEGRGYRDVYFVQLNQ